MAKHDRKALLIRIPTKTWKSLKRQAQENNRSLTAEISEILENSQLPTGTTTTSGGTLVVPKIF